MTARRLVDVVVALLGGVVLLPAFILLAVPVRLSGTPVLFLQPRSGRGGVPFNIVKICTMRNTRDARGALLPDALRVTAIGRLLRRSRLDELPELWNILIGDMSVIGPRPLLPATVEAMGPGGVARGAVRPGLSGWAQVNGNTLLSEDEKLALDLWYIENRSAALDVAIVLKTVRTVLFGERVDRLEIYRAYAGNPRRGG